jgi:hypothetical protein
MRDYIIRYFPLAERGFSPQARSYSGEITLLDASDEGGVAAALQGFGSAKVPPLRTQPAPFIV